MSFLYGLKLTYDQMYALADIDSRNVLDYCPFVHSITMTADDMPHLVAALEMRALPNWTKPTECGLYRGEMRREGVTLRLNHLEGEMTCAKR